MSSPFVDRLGWSLIHFLWEGTLIALALCVCLLLGRRKSAGFRYGLSCAALLAIAVCPIATFLALPSQQPIVVQTASKRTLAVRLQTAVINHESAPVYGPRQSTFDFEEKMPLVVLIWAVGVAVLSLRMIGGFFQVERLKRKFSTPASAEWQARLDRAVSALGMRQTVRLLVSSRIEVPATMGVFRSIVILPCGVILRLSPQEVEALLMHELAHIRRHDYLVNLIQTVIETALFYHPAVWWVGRTVRVEREHCCDDVAAAASENPVVYARALTSLEELRGALPNLSMSAKGGFLMNRISRVLGIASPPVRTLYVWPSFAILAALVAIMGFVVEGFAQSNIPKKKLTHSLRQTSSARTPIKHAKSTKSVAQVAHPDPLHTVQKGRGVVASDYSIASLDSTDPFFQEFIDTRMIDSKTKGIFEGLPNPAKTPTYFLHADGSITVGPGKTTNNNGKLKSVAEAQPQTISNVAKADLLDSDFAAAIQTVARQTGSSFVIASEKFPKVSVRFVNLPTVEAFNAICFAGNATWRRKGDIYYFEHKKEGQDTITDRVSLHLECVSVREAANQIARLIGASITVEHGSYDDVTISLNLDNATIQEALFELCGAETTKYEGRKLKDMRPIKWRQEGDTFIVSPG